MFPTLGDLFSYLFNTTVKINVPTFGAFMALAFCGAYVVFVSEFKRKERNGTIKGFEITEVHSNTGLALEIFLNTLPAFLLGYKVRIFLSALFHGGDAAEAFLSLKGSWVTGLLVAVVWAVWVYLDRRKGQHKTGSVVRHYIHPYQLMPHIVFSVAVWGLIGAKLFDAIEHIQELQHEPLWVLLSRGGFAYYGGLIFGALSYLYIGYRRNIPLIHMADIGSPGMMLAYGIGRIGCQLAGDGDWGIINRNIKPGWVPQWLWSSAYPHNAINAGHYIPGCLSQHCSVLPYGVYPTPLYEAIGCILLFGCLWFLRTRIKKPGQLFFTFLLLNGAERFLVELIRITPRYHVLDMLLSQAQMIALLFMLGGVAGFAVQAYRKHVFSPLSV